MRYDESDRESSNVEDRRGQGGGFNFPGNRGGRGVQIPIPMGRGGGFSITTLLIIGAIMLLLGINPLDLLRDGNGGFNFPDLPQNQRTDRPGGSTNPFDIPGLPGSRGAPQQERAGDDETVRFVRRVLADTEDVWSHVFRSIGRTYEEPRLVLFRGATNSACGTGLAQMGPFYCPLDRKVYLDLAFFNDLHRRFGAPGDFAQAYVIAHEVGHHVQNLLGIAVTVQRAKQHIPERQANALQVRMELQADCLAGVWAALNDQVKKRLQPGDVEEGLRAAAAIGDDMIQKRTQGRVVPEAFTHGSSEQRVRWFRRGLDSGQLQQCDTFNAGGL
ncbi:MAG: neutral zinc metallopeptidase [Hyphomicrobiaceae bacterium]